VRPHDNYVVLLTRPGREGKPGLDKVAGVSSGSGVDHFDDPQPDEEFFVRSHICGGNRSARRVLRGL
jgi:hypothetical protein